MEKARKRRRLSSHHSSEGKGIARNEDSPTSTKSNDKKEGESSPARCPICLATPENPAKSESCSHYFCFVCLKTWSKQKAECPLCKLPIRTIYYDIKSDTDFREYHVEQRRPEGDHFPFSRGLLNIESFDNWWHYRIREFRASQRRRQENTLAAREALSNVGLIRARRMHYWNKNKVRRVDTGNRVRDVSAEFYRDNPSQLHRLEPWLRRELTVLYGAHNKLLIKRVRDVIMAAIPTVGMTSRTFHNTIHPYMLEHTSQFIHEFVSFAKSPYDIAQYDRHAHYESASASEDPWSGEGSRNSSRETRRASRNPLRSRWDESPDASDNLPGEPTSQSVMLSQTSWGEDLSNVYPGSISSMGHVSGFNRRSNPLFTAGVPFPTPPQDFPVVAPEINLHYSSRRRYMTTQPTIDREVEAPLVHQTIDLHRPGGSSARHYHRMEEYRRHFERHSRCRKFEEREQLENRNKRTKETSSSAPTSRSGRQEVIVISSDSSDNEPGPSTSAEAGHSSNRSPVQVLHYRPTEEPGTSSRTEPEQSHAEIKRENSADASKYKDGSSNSHESDTSDIEFVLYVKPPHLRTPDAFIDISSTDEDRPGPSNRGWYYDTTKPIVTSSSTSSFSSRKSSTDKTTSKSRRHRRNKKQKSRRKKHASARNSTLDKTKNFLKDAKKTPHSHSNDDVTIPYALVTSIRHAESESRIDEATMTSSAPIITSSTPSTMTFCPMTTVSQSGITYGNTTIASQTTSESQPMTSQSSTKPSPKKIFERGKVTVNFDLSKARRPTLYSSDSDMEIDVGMESGTTLEILSRRLSINAYSSTKNHQIDTHDEFGAMQNHDDFTSPNPSITSSSGSNHISEQSQSVDLNVNSRSPVHSALGGRGSGSSSHKRKKHSRKSHKKSSHHHRDSKRSHEFRNEDRNLRESRGSHKNVDSSLFLINPQNSESIVSNEIRIDSRNSNASRGSNESNHDFQNVHDSLDNHHSECCGSRGSHENNDNSSLPHDQHRAGLPSGQVFPHEVRISDPKCQLPDNDDSRRSPKCYETEYNRRDTPDNLHLQESFDQTRQGSSHHDATSYELGYSGENHRITNSPQRNHDDSRFSHENYGESTYSHGNYYDPRYSQDFTHEAEVPKSQSNYGPSSKNSGDYRNSHENHDGHGHSHENHGDYRHSHETHGDYGSAYKDHGNPRHTQLDPDDSHDSRYSRDSRSDSRHSHENHQRSRYSRENSYESRHSHESRGDSRQQSPRPRKRKKKLSRHRSSRSSSVEFVSRIHRA